MTLYFFYQNQLTCYLSTSYFAFFVQVFITKYGEQLSIADISYWLEVTSKSWKLGVWKASCCLYSSFFLNSLIPVIGDTGVDCLYYFIIMLAIITFSHCKLTSSACPIAILSLKLCKAIESVGIVLFDSSDYYNNSIL